MKLEDAITGMLDAREKLRSRQGVTDPYFISEQMQRLAQYAGAIEEHLAQYEEDLEIEEHQAFMKHSASRSVNQAEKLAKDDVSELKGRIAKLKRYVNSSWAVIDISRSRINHITIEARENNHVV